MRKSDKGTKGKKFSALYYPYSRLICETDLKRALLVFDEIFFVDPLSKEISGSPGQQVLLDNQLDVRFYLETSKYKSSKSTKFIKEYYFTGWYNVKKYYKELQKEQIAKLINPSEYLRGSENIISYSVLRDISDYPGFYWDLFFKPEFAGKKWVLHSSRIPVLLKDLLKDKITLRTIVDKMLSDADKNARELFRKRINEVEDWNYFDEKISNKIVIPIFIAFPLIVNQALLLSEKLDAYPLTDDIFAHDMFLKKLSSIYMYSPTKISQIIPKPEAPDLYRVQSFTLSVISRLIPDEIFEKLEIKEVLEFRKENSNHLKNFRAKMIEMSSNITSRPWDQDFNAQVLRIIETRIVPEVNKIDQQLKDSLRKLFGTSVGKMGSTITKAVAPALPTLTLATFLGLSPGQIVLLGAASAMNALGIIFPDLMNYWKDKQSIKNNGLSFLLNFKNKFINDKRFFKYY